MNILFPFIPAQEAAVSADDSIDKVVDVLHAAGTTEEKTAAVAALNDIAKSGRQEEIGSKSLALIVTALHEESQSVELLRSGLELLLTATHVPTTPGSSTPQTAASPGLQNTAALVQDPNNVTLLLGLLQEQDFYVRYHCIQLLTQLLSNKSISVQDCIVRSPMGLNILMDVLADKREIIRNEALLLLSRLTQSNAEIQKIVVFNGAFDRLFEIIAEEGQLDGGIIANDCLSVVLALLRKNPSNQNYFREMGNVSFLVPLLKLESNDVRDQLAANLALALEVVALLAAGSPDTQAHMVSKGVLGAVTDIALGTAQLGEVRPDALKTLGKIIRGYAAGQAEFARASLPEESGNMDALARVLLLAFNAQSKADRDAALYLFQSYLFNNTEAQLTVAATITPPPTAGDGPVPVSAGRLLVTTLVDGASPVHTWCAAAVFRYVLLDNKQCKQLVLRTPLDLSDQGVSGDLLMTKLSRALGIAAREPGSTQRRMALLHVLAAWLGDCPEAVHAFLESPANVQMLLDLIGAADADVHARGMAAFCLGLCLEYNEEPEGSAVAQGKVLEIIRHQVGVDHFTDRLGQLKKSDDFASVERGGQGLGAEFDLYSNDFVHTFLHETEKIQQRIFTMYAGPKKATANGVGDKSDEDGAAAESYKDLIRMQDRQLKESEAEGKALKEQIKGLEAQLEERDADKKTIADLHDQLNALHSDKSALHNKLAGSADLERAKADLEERLALAESENQALAAGHTELEKMLGQKDAELASLRQQVRGADGGSEKVETASLHGQVNRLSAEGEQLRATVQHQETKIEWLDKEHKSACEEAARLRAEVESLRSDKDEREVRYVREVNAATSKLTEVEQRYATKVVDLEAALEQARAEKATLEQQLTQGSDDKDRKLVEMAAQLKQAQEDLEGVMGIKTDLQRELRTREGEIAVMRNQAGANDHGMAQLTSQVAALKAKLDAKAMEASDLGNQLDAKAIEVTDLRSQLAAVASTAASSKGADDAAAKDLRDALDQLREEHAALDEEHDDLLICLAEIEIEMGALQEENERLKGGR